MVAIGRLPGFRIDRAGATLLGAALMVLCGVLSLEEAYRAIDFDTVTLLLGTMIVVAHLKLSGGFALATGWIAERVTGGFATLAFVVLLSGVASAFLVNDTVCLALTPLVFELVSRQGRNPVPYLLALAMASNIGSTATITGNPQNIMIRQLLADPLCRLHGDARADRARRTRARDPAGRAGLSQRARRADDRAGPAAGPRASIGRSPSRRSRSLC
ncbi:MAG: SLC13 family permease [Pseudomonadota bacterium]